MAFMNQSSIMVSWCLACSSSLTLENIWWSSSCSGKNALCSEATWVNSACWLSVPSTFNEVKVCGCWFARTNCSINLTVNHLHVNKQWADFVSIFQVLMLHCAFRCIAPYTHQGPDKGPWESATNRSMTDTSTYNLRELAVPRGHSSVRGNRDTRCGAEHTG